MRALGKAPKKIEIIEAPRLTRVKFVVYLPSNVPLIGKQSSYKILLSNYKVE